MRRESEEWLNIAIEDLQSAECLFEKPLYRMACYHAQQCVEKVLKALLIEPEIDFPISGYNQQTHVIVLEKVDSEF